MLTDLIAGEVAYQLTKRLVIDMPTARAAVDAAFALAREQEAQPLTATERALARHIAAQPAAQEPSDAQILACLDDRKPVRLHHGAAVFEYRLFGLLHFARAVLALRAQPAAQEPTGIKDLRDAKWLDPECADSGCCQSLKFKAREQEAQPAATVKENPFCPDGKSDELDRYLPVGTKLYTAQPAAQEPSLRQFEEDLAEVKRLGNNFANYCLNRTITQNPAEVSRQRKQFDDAVDAIGRPAAAQPAAQEPSEPYDIGYAMQLAALWRNGKLMGGDPYAVCAALLDEVDRLRTAQEP